MMPRFARTLFALLASQLPLWCLVAGGLLAPWPAAICTLAGLLLAAPFAWRRPAARPSVPALTGVVEEDGILTLEALRLMSRPALAAHEGRGTVLALDLGHCGVAGDVLPRLISSLRMCLRRGDLLARVDSGRVVVLMPGLTEIDARAVASRLRQALSRRAPLLGARAPVPLGIATLLEGEGVSSAAVRAGLRADDDRAAMAHGASRTG